VPSRRTGLLLTTIASLLWGTTFIASQVGFQYTNPYNLVFLRFATAAVVIVIFALPFDNKVGLKRELGKKSTWLVGGVYASGFLLQFVGQDLTTASEATLLSNLAPILVPTVALAVLKDSMTNAQKVATVLGFVGLFLVASPRLSMGLTSVFGDVLLFGTSLCYTLFIVASKRLRVGSVGRSFAYIVATSVFLAPVAVYFGGLNILDLKMGLAGWASVLYLGFPCTLIAISLYLSGLSAVTVSESAMLLLLQILAGLVLASALLGEFLSPSQTIGAIAILSALVLGVKTASKRTESPSQAA
jgi:drug/metabolite transporter (DMT)-like permease